MIKGNVKFIHEPEIDPVKALADAVMDSAKRSDASNKAVVEAIKSIVVKAPSIAVAAPQVKVQMPETKRPAKWVFTMVRGADGLLESITAEAK